ncbi:MAG: hemolysin D, partial [Luteimonas sp.]
MNEPLFRPEVMQTRRGGWLGGIVLAQPVMVWVLTALAAASTLGIALFLLLGTYTQRARASGYLVSARGLATVTAPVTGV